eukprot:TRINITY_DN19098_c0_g1_i1.p1 TRINITY_DN19098_c0_g1~~TRINITY_DN19098_c0_g1_i1.p1  ORF type:complete len:592 (-),score=137.63 TRINITY_DN19098_c0_g1_i1:82-1857(-)
MLITSSANSAPSSAPQNLAVISQRLPFAAVNSATNANTNNSRTAGNGTLSIFPPTSTRLISNKYDDEPSSAANAADSASVTAVNSDYHKQQQSSIKSSHHPYYAAASSTPQAATATATLSLPGAAPSNSRRMPDYSGNYSGGAAGTNGHPREGQAASLLGGKYLLLEEIEGASLHRCLHIESNMEYICKVKPLDSACQRLLTAHYRVDGHPNINTIQEVVIGRHRVYLVLPPCHGDLHSYVRSRRRLREATARALFRQVVAAVHHAHARGIVLRDLKLRKFVFTDESRTELKLESLEDAVVLEDPEDDILSDKHGCPAYVSPEILKSNTQYSGRAADMWGLGVMLYTMLVGRYPFHGAEHSGLFAKIRRGQFSLPDHLSSRAKCLIRCLLRREPEERLTTDDVLVHPWLTHTSSRERGLGGGCSSREQRGAASGGSAARQSHAHHHHHHSGGEVMSSSSGGGSGSSGSDYHCVPEISAAALSAAVNGSNSPISGSVSTVGGGPNGVGSRRGGGGTIVVDKFDSAAATAAAQAAAVAAHAAAVVYHHHQQQLAAQAAAQSSSSSPPPPPTSTSGATTTPSYTAAAASGTYPH